MDQSGDLSYGELDTYKARTDEAIAQDLDVLMQIVDEEQHGKKATKVKLSAPTAQNECDSWKLMLLCCRSLRRGDLK